MKLSRAAAAAHARACDLVALGRTLTDDERLFVLENWQETEDLQSVLTGAFFTPLGLARLMVLHHVHGRRVLDLGAGIGRFGWTLRRQLRERNEAQRRELVCIERNSRYLEVGRKVIPEATWIRADLFTLPSLDLGSFDTVVANPPFSSAEAHGRAPRYRGPALSYAVIDVARDYAHSGVFLIPQPLAPFRYSGESDHRWDRSADYLRFEATTGIVLDANVGIDTTWYDGQWRGVKPRVEVVTCDYLHLLPVRNDQLSLWR